MGGVKKYVTKIQMDRGTYNVMKRRAVVGL